jgi:enoyl-CoA hydratase
MMNLQCFNLSLQDGWALLEMARPDRLNVLDETVLLELEDILKVLKEEKIKAVVLTGQGKAFAAGADVSAMAKMDGKEGEEFSLLGNRVFQMIEDHPAIFIAAVNGYALGGGCELALACDLCLASEKAAFGQPEINLGIIPGFGGTQRLPRIVGAAKAKEWIFTGQRFSAQEALEAGLVSRVLEPEQVILEATKLAEELAKKSGPILSLAKRAVAASGTGVNPAHGQQEASFFAKCLSTEDGREGLKAFVEKRSPVFKDR